MIFETKSECESLQKNEYNNDFWMNLTLKSLPGEWLFYTLVFSYAHTNVQDYPKGRITCHLGNTTVNEKCKKECYIKSY